MKRDWRSMPPSLRDLLSRSLPARSTRCSLLANPAPPPSADAARTCTVKIACERDDASFSACAAVLRRASPSADAASASASDATARCSAPRSVTPPPSTSCTEMAEEGVAGQSRSRHCSLSSST